MVLFRVEPGCLGPDGIEHIEKFCNFAEIEVANVDADFVHWDIVPRFDKTLPEIEYRISHKRLTHDKALKYLSLFDKNLDEFEEHLNDKLALLIDEFRANK